jgi:tryptophan-rich hypothetical protein
MKSLLKSKWTSIEKLNGWMHYEVLNVFKKKEKIELFPICKQDLKIIIPMQDLKNKSKWTPGWIISEESSAE